MFDIFPQNKSNSLSAFFINENKKTKDVTFSYLFYYI